MRMLPLTEKLGCSSCLTARHVVPGGQNFILPDSLMNSSGFRGRKNQTQAVWGSPVFHFQSSNMVVERPAAKALDPEIAQILSRQRERRSPASGCRHKK